MYQLAAQQRSYLAFELKPFSSKKREVVPITSVLTSRAACEGVMESEDLSGLAIVRYQQPYTVQNPGTPASTSGGFDGEKVVSKSEGVPSMLDGEGIDHQAVPTTPGKGSTTIFKTLCMVTTCKVPMMRQPSKLLVDLLNALRPKGFVFRHSPRPHIFQKKKYIFEFEFD